ncbi:protein ILRUN-like [Rhopilema esculentum]|uniref:protein ILRUN-like n=1 Tax=Rhopilema esculentum TaxID=499914 RepID=UPI0031D74F43
MDTDIDLDPELMNKLSTMGTRDHEDLVAQFQSVVGSQISPAGCAFYLDMANWNLQSALCAYYDIINSADTHASMQLVEDVTIKEGEVISPHTSFLKTWRIRNTGNERWPTQLRLVFTNGHNFANSTVIPVHPIDPGTTTDLTIPMMSPMDTGCFRGQWRLADISNNFFGDPLYVIINVEHELVFNLTQQMSALGHQHPTLMDSSSVSGTLPTRAQPIATPQRGLPTVTPYCSPTGYGIFGGSPISSSFRGTSLPTIDESARAQLQDMTVDDRLHSNEYDTIHERES